MDKETKKELFKMIFWVGLFLCLVIFSSCAPRFSEKYSLDGWSVNYMDDKTLDETCPPSPWGCTKTSNKTIYCNPNNNDACGHELRHAVEGGWHK